MHFCCNFLLIVPSQLNTKAPSILFQRFYMEEYLLEITNGDSISIKDKGHQAMSFIFYDLYIYYLSKVIFP